MRDDRVNESSQKGGVNKIGNELSSLCDRATSNTSSRYGEGPLVQEEAVIDGGRREVSEPKEVAADEAVRGSTEGESEAEYVVGEAASSGIKDVREHDVHRVFGSYGAGTEHGES